MNYLVSIPVWFDWEYFAEQHQDPKPSFQFQYGSIGRNTHFNQLTIYVKSFNSSMVRLGGAISGMEVLKAKFQFQYGSIGS